MSKKLPSKKDVTRREFVKTAAGAGMAAAAFTVSPWGSIRAWATQREFDYIIVGSGAGGGTLAARLVQKKKRVLLIEAGSREKGKVFRTTFPIFEAKEPVAHAFASEDPNLAWGFYVKHYKELGEKGKQSRYLDSMNHSYDKNVYGDEKRTGIFYPRGSTLGGSTAVNAMITLYPDSEDWNEMSTSVKDASWEAENMWEIFRRLNPNVIDGPNGAKYMRPETPEWQKEVIEWAQPWLQNQHLDQDIIKLILPDQTTQRVLFAALVGTYFSGMPVRQEMQNILGKMRNLKLTDLDGFSSDSFQRSIRQIFNRVNPNTWDYVTMKTKGDVAVEGFLDIPRATLKGRRFGTRDLLERMEELYGPNGSKEPGLFEIQDNSLVTSVQFDFPSGGRPKATGVHVQRRARYGAEIAGKAARLPAGGDEFIRVSEKGGEVILAAGAFNTPQILMLSGIGPADELVSAGITPVKDLAGVGKNLQDRYEVTITTELEKNLGVLDACDLGFKGKDGASKKDNDQCLQTWDADPSQSLYQSNGVLAAITKRSSIRKGSPDLMVFCLGGNFEGYKYQYSHNASKKNFVSWAVLKGHTENTAGEVKIRSKDPTETPEVNFNYFDDGSPGWENDLQAVVDGTNLVRDRLRSSLRLDSFSLKNPLAGVHKKGFEGTHGWKEHLPADLLKEYNAKDSKNPNLQPPVKDAKDAGQVKDRELKDWVQKNAWGHHASCTCKMGPSSDRMAVVDSKFRVHGIDNLRVVDASVFPKIPGLFIAVPTYMIGEKAAEAIAGEESKDELSRNRG